MTELQTRILKRTNELIKQGIDAEDAQTIATAEISQQIIDDERKSAEDEKKMIS